MKYCVLMFSIFSMVVAEAGTDIPVVRCPAEPPQVRRLQLREQWRIDAEDPATPLMGYFGQSQIIVHDGRVYMLDGQLCHILVYNDNGEYITTIIREGEGPGEVRNPGAMFLRSDGCIAVQHGYPTKMEFVDLDGVPRGRWHLRANAWINRIQETPQGWFGVYTESKQGDDPNVFISVFHAALLNDNGERTSDFYSAESRRFHQLGGKIDEAEEFNPWFKAVAVGNGEVVLAAARDKYRLEWRNLGGETTRIVTREFPAHYRTKAELNRLKYSSYSMVNGDLRFPDRKLCDYDPVIQSLELLPDGCLRVRTSLFEKDMPEGMVCRYEVHDATGGLRESVEIYDPTGKYDTVYDAVALLDDGRVMVLRNMRSAFRAATDARLHPKVREKLPPVPDDRDDVIFTPVMCETVPYSESTRPLVSESK